KNGAVTPLTWFQLARPVTLHGFNLNDLGAQIAQEQRAKWPRETLRKVQYSHVVERYGHDTWSMAVMAYGGSTSLAGCPLLLTLVSSVTVALYMRAAKGTKGRLRACLNDKYSCALSCGRM